MAAPSFFIVQLIETSEFELYTEALSNDDKRTRLWDCFYADKFSTVNLTSDTINKVIVEGFAPVEEAGKTRNPDASEVVARIKKKLEIYLQDKYQSHLNEMDMNVEKALILEARYIAAKNNVYKPGEPESNQIDIFDETFSRHQRNIILERVEDKDIEKRCSRRTS